MAEENELLSQGLYEVYDSIDRRYGHEAPSAQDSRLAAATKRVIDEAIAETDFQGKTLRADAKLYLSVNAYYLIVLPLEETRGPIHDIPPEDIVDATHSDARSILKDAVEKAEGEVVSGHDVVDATSRKWEELQTTRTGTWLKAESGY